MTALTMKLTRADALATGAPREWAHVAADLTSAHLEAAQAAAELDLDQAAIWVHADTAISEVATEAYQLAALITGRWPLTTGAHLRPVARLRELAAAQAGLMRALDLDLRIYQPDAMVAAEVLRSAQRIHVLAERLVEVHASDDREVR